MAIVIQTGSVNDKVKLARCDETQNWDRGQAELAKIAAGEASKRASLMLKTSTVILCVSGKLMVSSQASRCAVNSVSRVRLEH